MYWDLACNFFFIIFVGFTATADKLSIQRPSNSLFCFSNLFEVLFSFCFVVLGQISMIFALSGKFAITIDYEHVGGL